jgi:hypothetical protein
MTLRALLQITADCMILSGLRKTIAAKIHLTAYFRLAATTGPWITHAANGNMCNSLVWLGYNLHLTGLCIGRVFLSEKSSEEIHSATWTKIPLKPSPSLLSRR